MPVAWDEFEPDDDYGPAVATAPERANFDDFEPISENPSAEFRTSPPAYDPQNLAGDVARSVANPMIPQPPPLDFESAIKTGHEATGKAMASLNQLAESAPKGELGPDFKPYPYEDKPLTEEQWQEIDPMLEAEKAKYLGIDLPSFAPSMATFQRLTRDPFTSEEEVSNEALAQIPPSLGAKVAVGAIEGVDELARGVVKFFTSPSGLGQLGLAASPVGEAVYVKWAVDMARAGYQSVQQAVADFKKSDWQAFSKDVVTAFGMFLGTKGAAGHGFKLGEAKALALAPRGTGIEAPRRPIPVMQSRAVERPEAEAEMGITDAEAEEAFQLEQMQKEGKLSKSDADRLDELNRKSDEFTESEVEPVGIPGLDEATESELKEVGDEMGVEIQVLEEIDPNGPNAGMVATIDRAGNRVLINPKNLSEVLSEIKDPAARRDYIRSFVSEEQVHLATHDEVASNFFYDSTGLEQFIARRRYTKTISGKLHGEELSPTLLGHEMLRLHMQTIRGMTPTEVAHAVATGRGRFTAKTLVAMEQAIFEIRARLLKTKASERQLAYLDEVLNNIKGAKAILAGGGAQPASPSYGQPGEESKKFSEAFEDLTTSRVANSSDKPTVATTREYGMKLKSLADLDEMLRLNNQARARMNDLKAKGAARTPEENKEMFALAGRVQFPREMVETATNTGGWSIENERNKPGAKALSEDRPLDWTKHPEVENWLRQHADEIKIQIPERAPASPRYGMSEKAKRLAEQARRLREMQAKARGEEIPEELRTRSVEPEYPPTPPEERVGAVESGAPPRAPLMTTQNLEARMQEHLAGPIAPAEKKYTKKQLEAGRVEWQRPTFEDFAKQARYDLPTLKPEQLRDMWEDRVWGEMLKAPGDRLKQWQQALGLVNLGKTPAQIRRGVGGALRISDVPTPESLTEERQFKTREELDRRASAFDKKAADMRHLAEGLKDKPDVKETTLFGEVSTRDAEVKSLLDKAADLEKMAQKIRSLSSETTTTTRRAGPSGKPLKAGETARLPLEFKNYAPKEYQEMVKNQPALEAAAPEAAGAAGPEYISNRYRSKLIAAIADKLIRESVEGRPDLERESITVDDIATSSEKTKIGAYYEITRDDMRQPGRLETVLRDQARGSSSDPESASRRVVVVVGKDGRVHLLSTYNDAGIQRVVDPAGTRLKIKPTRELNKEFLERYRPFVSLLLDDPVKGLRQSFDSVSQFMDQMGSEAKGKSEMVERGFPGEGMAPEDFEAEGTPGLEGEGGSFVGPSKGAIPAEGRRPVLKSKAPLTIPEADALLNHIMDKLESGKMEGTDDVRVALRELLIKSEKKKLTGRDLTAMNAYRKIFNAIERKDPNESVEEIVDQIVRRVFDASQSAKTGDAFSKAMVAEFGRREAQPLPMWKSAQWPVELTMPSIRPPTSQQLFAGPFQREAAPPAELGATEPKAYVPESVKGERLSQTEQEHYAQREYEVTKAWAEAFRDQSARQERLREKAMRIRSRIYRKKGVLTPLAEAAKLAGYEGPMSPAYESGKGVTPKQDELLKNFYRAANYVASRTKYGQRQSEIPAPSFKVSWSNGSRRWNVWPDRLKKGDKVKLDANEITVRATRLADAKLIAEHLPEHPLDRMSAENNPLLEKGKALPANEMIDKLREFWDQEPKTPDVVDATSRFMDAIRSPEQRTTDPLAPRYSVPRKAGEFVSGLIKDFGSGYDEWMVDRMVRHGGQVSQEAGEAFRHIIDREKELYGKLTPMLDKARTMAGGAVAKKVIGRVPSPQQMRAVNWANEIIPTPGAKFSGTSRVVDVFESQATIPPYATELVNASRLVNLEVGRMLQQVIRGFQATGKFQRNINATGYDVIREGRGDMWRKWTAATAVANGAKLSEVRTWFREFKEVLDTPGVDSSAIEKVNQDFTRKFPKVVTHIKSAGQWQPVVHADLFNYLENTARRATHVTAFREIFPNNTAGRAKLQDVKESVRNEMGAAAQSSLDSMIRTMQGIPTDNYSSYGILGPTRAVGQAFRFMNNTVGTLMARLALTGQMIVQPGENIAGSIPVFLGYKNYLHGLAVAKQLYGQMEQHGAVNRAIYDFSWNKNSPVRSAFKMASNLVSKIFAEQALNELQEASAAATARVVSERIKNGMLTPWEERMLPETFRAMGFPNDEVAPMMMGDPRLLDQFVRKASAFLTSGNRAISEGSALGANRLFNSVFRFQSYPMMKANQLRKVTSRMADAWTKGDANDKKQATEMFARFMFGNTLQGAATVAITTAFYSGIMGLKIRKEEAEDEPVKFLLESYLATVSGPLYLMYNSMKYKGVAGFGDSAARMIFPYGVVTEMNDMVTGKGRYRDQDTFAKIGEFLKARTPGSRAVSQGLALVGLSQKDKKLDAALDGFYRWRRDTLGFDERRSFLKKDELDKFRVQLRKAVDALKSGNADKFSDAYMAAAEEKAELGRKGSVSFVARKVLRNAVGGPLTLDEMDALRKRIGDEAVDRLEYFDMMLEAAGKGAALPKYDE